MQAGSLIVGRGSRRGQCRLNRPVGVQPESRVGHVIAGDELFDDGGGFALLGLVVFGEESELLPENAAGSIGFLDGQLGAVVGHGAESGFFAGERGEFADADGIAGLLFAAWQQEH